jgi:hypothetical protein
MEESSGYEKLKAAVMRDCNERAGCGCFNPDGCNIKNQSIGKYGEAGHKHCFHAYCDKFKWVIDRARHYAEKTGIPWEDILNSWEADRNYWYMNYYQDGNQPEIKGDRVKVFETVEEMLASIGDKKFRCPLCGGVSTNPYECNSGLKMSNRKACDWKVYGLLRGLGKDVFVYCKDKVRGERIFMPLSWENESDRPSAETDERP